MPVRTVVVWCPDWPLQAAGLADVPAAVVGANRVLACSAPARAHGVRPGLRRREAQARCPDLRIVPHDPARDARAFEPLVRVVEGFCPAVEVLRPGTCAFGARGPARCFGGEEALARRVAEAVGHGARVGIADGLFAAVLAARAGVIVDPGRTPAFLAPYPVTVLGRPGLADLLLRLGVRTLGDLAALPAPQVLGRFGAEGAEAHRLARGLDERPLAPRPLPPDLTVQALLDPPADRVDRAAFTAKALADELHERLAREGLHPSAIRIEAETEHGERLARRWRHEGGLSAQDVADRVRWQLEGWLAGGGVTGGLQLLRIVPEELLPARGRQRGFWGSETGAEERAARALARVQGMLGPEGVCTAVLGGGRSFAEQATLVPWGEARSPARPGLPGEGTVKVGGWPRAELPPWPGRVGGPAPATVWAEPPPAEVLDAGGRPVRVSGRGLLSAPPAVVTVGGRAHAVEGWAGPWPVDERWWDRLGRRRRARLQVLLREGGAHLLSLERGGWRVEATYD